MACSVNTDAAGKRVLHVFSGKEQTYRKSSVCSLVGFLLLCIYFATSGIDESDYTHPAPIRGDRATEA